MRTEVPSFLRAELCRCGRLTILKETAGGGKSATALVFWAAKFFHIDWKVFDMHYFKTGKKHAALFFYCILFITIASGFPTRAAEGTEKSTASAAPDFELRDLNGGKVTLSQFKGQKPVLLDFWATWCDICMSVRPSLIELRKTTPEADLEIIAIDVDSGDSLARLKRFETANPAPYIVLYDADAKVTKSYKVEGIPHFVLIDKGGAVKYEGARLPSDLMSLLK